MRREERPGEFPFAIAEGAEESKYLTWVRNHSNYVAARGLVDYLRAGAVLLRGMLGNLLVFTPYLLVLALAVAAARFFGKPPPFALTKTVVALSVLWVFLFLVLPPVFRIVRYRTSTSTGTDSSVKERSLYEGTFGGLLLLGLLVAGFESLPGLLEVFHRAVVDTRFGWAAAATVLVVAAAVFGVLPRVLSALGEGARRKVVLSALGILGLLPLLLFVLFVAHFVVFGAPRDWTEPLKYAGRGFPIAIFGTVAVGLALGALRLGRDWRPILGLLVCALGLLGVGEYVDRRVLRCCLGDANAKNLDAALIELKKRPAELRTLLDGVVRHPGPRLAEVAEWLDEVREQRRIKRDFFRRLMVESDELQVPVRSRDAYREYLETRGAELPRGYKNLLAEWVRELGEELRNEAHQVGGLSPIVEWVNRIEDQADRRSDEESERLLHWLHRLYRQVTDLRELAADPSPPVLAAKLRVLDLARPSLEESPLPADHLAELERATRSLTPWIARLEEVRAEIAEAAPAVAADRFADSVERLAKKRGSKLHALLRDLEARRQEAETRRASWRSELGEPEPSLEDLLPELSSLGHADPDLYALVRLSQRIRRHAVEHPEESDALAGESRLLYRRAAILGDLSTARSLEELVIRLVSLFKEDLRFVEGTHCDDPESVEYPALSKLEGPGDREFTDVDCGLANGAFNAFLLRDEIVATAILAEDGSPLAATPVALRVRENYFWPKFAFVGLLALQLWFLCWLTLDVNLTSIHGWYRDRLAAAFLVADDGPGGVRVEEDLDLMEICDHEAGSIAPYHLINVALNLQGSRTAGLRDRNSDFFLFSKLFTGGPRTGYCRSEHMERVFPQMDLATAMAISAGAAAPNMGRGTTPALVALMTLLNIRMGYWVPNPKRLEDWLWGTRGKETGNWSYPGPFSFADVFREELAEVEARWAQLDDARRGGATEKENRRRPGAPREPAIEHGLVGIGYSGGGIRSATLNLGITQALHRRGFFDHVDYMSTVSGGGYLGASISTLMRRRPTGDAPLPQASAGEGVERNSVGELFRWRVRPAALAREILSRLDEESRLVNVSDGGHIENLAGIELLRRRCRYIILGDGEADSHHHFGGLATLIQTARVDLRVEIEIDTAPLRLNEGGRCRAHWAIGRVRYPEAKKRGYLLYLKSSITGDEDEVIRHYRNTSPSFPHESTADQLFGEGQFEAYRSLGQHIGERALAKDADRGDSVAGKADGPDRPASKETRRDQMSFDDLEKWFGGLWRVARELDRLRVGTEPA